MSLYTRTLLLSNPITIKKPMRHTDAMVRSRVVQNGQILRLGKKATLISGTEHRAGRSKGSVTKVRRNDKETTHSICFP